MKKLGMKKISTLIFVFLLLISGTVYSNNSHEIGELFEHPLTEADIEKKINIIKENLPNDIPKALDIAKKLLNHGLVSRNDSLIDKSNFYLGLVYYYKDYYRVSSRYYIQALEGDLTKENVLFRLKCENNLGINYDLLEDYDQALFYYKRSLTSAKKLGDSTEIFEIYINIGLVYSNLKDISQAIYYTNFALEFFEKTNDKINMALCLQNLSIFEMRLEHYDNAKALALKAIALYTELNDNFMAARVYHNYANIYTDLNSFDESNAYNDTALTMIKEFNSPYYKSKFLLSRAINERYLKHYAESEMILLEICPTLFEYGVTQSIKSAFHNLTMLYYDWKKAEKHSEYLKKYDSVCFAMNKSEMKKSIQENLLISVVDKNFTAIKHQNQIIEQRKFQIIIGVVFTVLLLIVLVVVVKLNKDLRKSYHALYEKSISENLTKPMVAPSESENSKDLELYTFIVDAFEVDKIYQDPKLSLIDISERLNSNEKYISQAIKKFSNVNFNSFVNKYRIEEAKGNLVDQELMHYSIEKIAELSGFNNRITFTRVFKEITKLSPSAFRKLSKKNLIARA
ncbi:helix-turn-helix domain-containing protein [bacterium]|nr:helix-turn-helix domain-containing protein [bacterium]